MDYILRENAMCQTCAYVYVNAFFRAYLFIYYLGLGMVTPLGCGVETTWKRLIKGESGIRALCVQDLKMSGFDKDTQSYTFDHLASKIAATVPCGTNPGEFNEQSWLDSKHSKSIARFISYALCAADEALRDANWIPSEQEDKEKTGVSIGGGVGSIGDILDASQLICEKRLRRLSPFFVPRMLINMAAGHVSMKYGFQGPSHAAVTACATGANSIGDAARMIQFGDADVMEAGGTEASIDALSIAGFCRLRALATKYNVVITTSSSSSMLSLDGGPTFSNGTIDSFCDEELGEEGAGVAAKPGEVPPQPRRGALAVTPFALRDSNWIPSEQEDKEKTGVSIGGGVGSIGDILDASQLICVKRLRRLSPFFVPRMLINMAAGHGPSHAAVTACATGANSIGDAARMIQFGDADVMEAGGTEASIDALSIAGFCRLRALATKYNSTPQEASRPFDCDRDGFVIGEGAGVLVLEELEHAKNRGANIYAELRRYGMSGDAHHITQPHADGRGAILAMSRALKQSGLSPDQVDYVNAHATSTPLGDMVEALAIKTLFSDHATSGALAFSSTKGAIGHLLGAAGAVEAIFTVLAIRNGIAPLSLNLSNPDPIFERAFMPLVASKEMQIKAALSNALGFGGTNAALLFATI
ncbi:3-oxoacyl-[acyl-carrier-protein] synthase, mitochondrial [Tanacetum coccineum]